jgi:hypothetical protein
MVGPDIVWHRSRRDTDRRRVDTSEAIHMARLANVSPTRTTDPDDRNSLEQHCGCVLICSSRRLC